MKHARHRRPMLPGLTCMWNLEKRNSQREGAERPAVASGSGGRNGDTVGRRMQTVSSEMVVQ